MDNVSAIGWLVIGLGSLIGIITPILKLNTSITKLNSNMEHMLDNDKRRDTRITKHGEEIDELKIRQNNSEKILDRHELRIGTLEERVNKGQ